MDRVCQVKKEIDQGIYFFVKDMERYIPYFLSKIWNAFES